MALYVTATFAVVIIVLFAVLSELYEGYSYRAFDVTLQAAASAVANGLSETVFQKDKSGIKEDAGESLMSFERKIGIIRVVIFDSLGRQLLSLNDPGLIAERATPESFTRRDRRRKFLTIRVHDKPYRAAIANFETHGESQGTVVVIASLSATRESIDRVQALAFILAPLTILIVAIGSVTIAKRSLRPLEKMAADIDEIGYGKTLSTLAVPESKDEIKKLSESFNSLIRRINALIETQRSLLLDASHQLKTPLTVIQAEIEMLLMRRDLTETERENLKQLLSEAEYASGLAVDLIYLSRLESVGPHEFSLVSLDSLVESIVSRNASLAKHRSIKLLFEPSNECNVRGDTEMLKRALSNIIDNAIKYSGERGEVRVVTRMVSNGAKAIVEVHDKGQGIDAEELGRVFDRFYRTRSARSGDEKGSGLGLSIAKRIVEQHGGKISIESEVGVGTSVTIELPV